MSDEHPFRDLMRGACNDAATVASDAVVTETLSVSTEAVDEMEIEHDGVWYDLEIRDERPVLVERDD